MRRSADLRLRANRATAASLSEQRDRPSRRSLLSQRACHPQGPVDPLVIGELFKMITGVNLTHVPYRSAGPAITDLLGGQIQVTFTDMAASIEYIRAGRLRALAVTTAMRSEAL